MAQYCAKRYFRCPACSASCGSSATCAFRSRLHHGNASMSVRGDMWMHEALVQVVKTHHPILRRIVSGCGGRQAAA